MKKIFTPLLILLMVSCKESGVQLAKPSTFVRYFNGGFQDQAQAVIETADKGFLILVNSGTVCTSAKICSDFRIKLIKTDAFGNQQWQSFFPDPSDISPKNFQGFGLAALKDNSGIETGYVVTGTEIYDTTINNTPTTASALLMIQINNTDGAAINSTPKSYKTLPIQAQGFGVAASQNNGDIFVVGANLSSALSDMFCTRLSAGSLAPIWFKQYGSGGDKVAHKLLLSNNGDAVFWAATRPSQSSSTSAMSLIKVSTTDGSVYQQFYNPTGNVSFNLTSNDVCKYSNGFALVGSYSLPSNNSISYTRVAFATTDELDNQGDSVTYNIGSQTFEPGNSICSAEGGTVVLATTGTDSNPNYYLFKLDLKVNGDGSHSWTKGWQYEYGGQFPDYGVQVIQASDGGFVVLGTTILGGVSNALLMKTDSQGKIQ